MRQTAIALLVALAQRFPDVDAGLRAYCERVTGRECAFLPKRAELAAAKRAAEEAQAAAEAAAAAAAEAERAAERAEEEAASAEAS
jgi:hypothetical protein